jgi:hypothetical protein
MAESANKQLLSALTEGHEKGLKSSARSKITVQQHQQQQAKKSSGEKSGNSRSTKSQKVVNSVSSAKCRTNYLIDFNDFINFIQFLYSWQKFEN